jgi:hypothetical protein
MAAEATTTPVEDFQPFVASPLWELPRKDFAAIACAEIPLRRRSGSWNWGRLWW